MIKGAVLLATLEQLSVSNRPIKRQPISKVNYKLRPSRDTNNPLPKSRRMSSDRKSLSVVVLLLIVTTLLSCCCSPASSFAFLPRVSRTNDAIIINFAGVGYAPFYHGKTLQGHIVNPEFVPLPSFNLQPMAFRQQQQDPSGWSYSFGYPIPIALEDASSSRQGGGATTTTTSTTTPAPAIKCGQGPTALPKQSLMSERVSGSGSTSAKANAWPFLVILKKYVPFADYEDDGGGYFCSGSLISDTKVLLAANCLQKMSVYEMSRLSALVGVTSKSDVQMTRRIAKVVLHSKFNAATYANDIAIITLDAPVVISRTVGPVCLAPASTEIDQYADQSAVIMGWGLESLATAGTVLKQGTVLISSNFDCKADEKFGKYVTDANICISATDKFVCADDVGGPVVVLSSPGIWTQIGINSYTPSDCDSNSLQTRVSAFRAWIDLYKN